MTDLQITALLTALGGVSALAAWALWLNRRSAADLDRRAAAERSQARTSDTSYDGGHAAAIVGVGGGDCSSSGGADGCST